MPSSPENDRYRSLLRWSADAQTRLKELGPGEQFAVVLSKALNKSGDRRVQEWLVAHERLSTLGDEGGAFQEAFDVFQSHGIDLLDVYTDVGSQAVATPFAAQFTAAAGKLADKTDLVALRFLSAWMALNDNQLETCINECEKITQPYSSVYTLMGQALLETGRANEAIDALMTAVELNPYEPLSWFQLAKAHAAISDPASAWMALEKCAEFVPHSEEVALFMAMVALEQSDNPIRLANARHAFMMLIQHLRENTDNGHVVHYLCALAAACRDRDMMSRIVKGSAWFSLGRDFDFLKKFPEILRQLEQLGWMDLAARILSAMMPEQPGPVVVRRNSKH